MFGTHCIRRTKPIERVFHLLSRKLEEIRISNFEQTNARNFYHVRDKLQTFYSIVGFVTMSLAEEVRNSWYPGFLIYHTPVPFCTKISRFHTTEFLHSEFKTEEFQNLVLGTPDYRILRSQISVERKTANSKFKNSKISP